MFIQPLLIIMMLCFSSPIITHMRDEFPYGVQFCLDYTFHNSLDDGIYTFFWLNFLNDAYESLYRLPVEMFDI